MKRKNFILQVTAATAAVVAGSLLCYKFLGTKHPNPLTSPDILGRFCNHETLQQIGNSYLQQNQIESTKEKLTDLLLADDSAGKKINSTDTYAVTALLKEKIHKDFLTNQTVVIKGWLITNTEARQCALFSLTSNSK